MPQTDLSLTSDPIPGLILRIALPTSVGMLFNTLFNVADTVCAGLLSTDALAALSLSFPLYFVVIAVGSGLSQGSTALMAIALGNGDTQNARRLYAQSLLACVCAGAILTVAGWLAAPWLFQLLGASGAYLTAVLAFMNVILAGSVFFNLTMVINSALGAQGETRPYRDFLIVAFLANCALDPVLMWGWLGLPRLGVSGIGLATVLVQAAGCAWLWRRVRKNGVFAGLAPELFRPDRRALKEIFVQSGAAVLNMLTIALGIFVITWFARQFGKEAVAALGAATRIEQIILLPAIGLGTAMLSLAGQNSGAGLPGRVREAWQVNLAMGLSLMALGGVILWLAGPFLMRLFTSTPAVIRDGTSYLRMSSLTLAAYTILFATVFMMQGLKRPFYGLWIGIYRQVLAPTIIMHLLVNCLGWGLQGVWIGFAIVTWSAALFALWWGWRTVRGLAASPDALRVSTARAGID